jgi:hypothetical protein
MSPISTICVPFPISAIFFVAVLLAGCNGGEGGGNGVSDITPPAVISTRTLSVIGVPSSRSGHTAIWTGDHMIVWGGNDGSLANSGAIYDPLTDTWRTIALTNVPAGRTGHTAVWSGAEMIVWGGSGLNTGGRYTP